MTDVMLDLETLSVRPDAAILVIGAVKFSRKGCLLPLKELPQFYRRITIDSCRRLNMRIDQSTMEWWEKQEQCVRFEALENPDRVPLSQALREFNEWMSDCRYVWGNGDDFDCTILGEAYTRCGIETPWKFWNTRDVRTIFDLAGIRKSDLPDNDQHQAVADCYRQIVGVKRSLKSLGK